MSLDIKFWTSKSFLGQKVMFVSIILYDLNLTAIKLCPLDKTLESLSYSIVELFIELKKKKKVWE